MQYLLILFFLVACGKSSQEGTIFTPANFTENKNIVPEKVENKFFDVTVDSFQFQKLDENQWHEIEFKKSHKFEFYKILAGRHFLNHQTNLYSNQSFVHEIPSHNVTFHLEQNKKSRIYPLLINPKQIESEEVSTVRGQIKGSIYIDQASLSRASGIEIKVWDYYQHDFFEVGFVPISDLQKTDDYHSRYDFFSTESFPLARLRLLLERNLRLVFSLRFENKQKSVVFFHKDKEGFHLREFKDHLELQKFTLEKIKSELKNKKEQQIHNYDKRSSSLPFYYDIPFSKQSLIETFTYFRQRSAKVLGVDDLAGLSGKEELLEAEFFGKIFQERYKTKLVKRKIRVHANYEPWDGLPDHDLDCILNYQVLDGLNYNFLSLSDFPWKERSPFSSIKDEFSIEGLSYFHWSPQAFSKEKFDMQESATQRIRIGLVDSIQKCGPAGGTKRFLRTQDHQSEVLIKEDVFKVEGTVKYFDIPWDQITWSLPLQKFVNPNY